MKELGGYFELELRKGKEFHPDAIALNTGRNALELILRTKKYNKVYIPFYTCDVVLEPIKKLDIAFEFYHINADFEPEFDFSKIMVNEGFLYTNYFGLKDKFIASLATFCTNLIIDSTQSFFSNPIKNIPTFYSCRKFFGVPDGSYLYLNDVSIDELPYDHSENRFAHLLKRIEYRASEGYNDFKVNDNSLVGQPILKMSKLTKALLCNIDYEYVKNTRVENFLTLHKQLAVDNQLNINLDTTSVPMLYPLLTKRQDLKQMLKENKIYVATYWPNVLEWCDKNQVELKMAKEIIYLPIDQRYGKKEMDYILSNLLNS